MIGKRHFSRTLTAGQRREIGRYEEAWSSGLPGLSRGITLAVL